MKWSTGKQLLATQPHHHYSHHTPLPTLTTYCNIPYLSPPTPPRVSATLPRKGNAVPGKKPIQAPESMTAPDRWPQSGARVSRGVGCAAVHVSPCQERVTTVWLCVLHQQKNIVSIVVSTRVWGMVVLSSFFFPISAFLWRVWDSLSRVTAEVKLISLHWWTYSEASFTHRMFSCHFFPPRTQSPCSKCHTD